MGGDDFVDSTRLASAGLYTRTMAQNTPALLLTRAEVERSYDRETREWNVVSWTRVAAVYRYDFLGDQLEAVPNEAWQQAIGPIGECERGALTTNQVDFNKRNNRLHLNWHLVEAAGRQLIHVAPSPSGAKVAVLSAGGVRGPNFMPFSGSAPIRGQRYHQVYSLTDDQFFEETVLLPSRESELGWSEPSICWTADERYVVYSDSVHGLVIAPGQPSGNTELR